jgi:hypothetical protein
MLGRDAFLTSVQAERGVCHERLIYFWQRGRPSVKETLLLTTGEGRASLPGGSFPSRGTLGSTHTALLALALSNRQRIQTPTIWLNKVSVATQDPLHARRRHSPHLARTEQEMTANDSYQRFHELEAMPR